MPPPGRRAKIAIAPSKRRFPPGGAIKAILLHRTGDPSVLEYTEVPTLVPGPGEVIGKLGLKP